MPKAGGILKDLRIGRDAVVVTNKKISSLYGKTLQKSLAKHGISSKIELVADSEKAKSHKALVGLLDRISSYDKKKALFIIALGGGVVGDLAGFAASVYKRGVPYVQIPTTLLAQVDSAIGGKVAIDLPSAKNLAGSFYQPKAVISDVSVLNSLSGRELRSGLAECIKYGVIKDKHLFGYLEDNYKKVLALNKECLERVILSSSRIKAKLVESDELDNKGRRMVLNYGHTIGHAIEAASGYSGRYNHGEAVAIGMIVAARIASRLRILNGEDAFRIESLITKCGLPAVIRGLKFPAIYEAHLHDKKFGRDVNRLVLPVRIGQARIVEDIPDSVITESIKEYMH